MTKKCAQEGCNAQISDAYVYCMQHHAAKKAEAKPLTSEDLWNSTDPLIKVLAQINANLGTIAKFITGDHKMAKKIQQEMEEKIRGT